MAHARPRHNRLRSLDLRWFILAACLLVPFSFLRLKTVQQWYNNGVWADSTIIAPMEMIAATSPDHGATNKSNNRVTKKIRNTTAVITAPFSSSSLSLKYHILDVPEVTSWLIGNNSERASLYYAKSLNEESAEIWLHRGFERMRDEQGYVKMDQNVDEEADVYIIPGYLHFYLAIHRSSSQQEQAQASQKKKKNGRKEKKVKVDLLDHSYLVQLYKERIINKRKPHLLIIPTWNPGVSTKIGLKRLVSSLQTFGVTNLWSVGFERNKMWQGLSADRIVPIPYVVNTNVPPARKSRRGTMMMENTMFPPKNTSTSDKDDRRNSDFIFYAGDSRPNAKGWAGCDREGLIFPLQEQQNETALSSSMKNKMDVRIVSKHNRINQTYYNYRMTTSEYCLILCGDTPSSRSLTSAMTLGCIPIRVGSRLRGLCEPPCHKGFGWQVTGAGLSHLPFEDELPWALFPEVDELEFMQDGRQVLHELIRKMNDTSRNQQQHQSRKEKLKAIMQHYQTSWIYGWGNPINSTQFGDAVPQIWKSFVHILQSNTTH